MRKNVFVAGVFLVLAACGLTQPTHAYVMYDWDQASYGNANDFFYSYPDATLQVLASASPGPAAAISQMMIDFQLPDGSSGTSGGWETYAGSASTYTWDGPGVPQGGTEVYGYTSQGGLNQTNSSIDFVDWGAYYHGHGRNATPGNSATYDQTYGVESGPILTTGAPFDINSLSVVDTVPFSGAYFLGFTVETWLNAGAYLEDYNPGSRRWGLSMQGMTTHEFVY